MVPSAPAYIANLRPLATGRTYDQTTLATWLAAALRRSRGSSDEVNNAIRFFSRLVRSGAIASRSSVIQDFGSLEPKTWALYAAKEDRPWYRPGIEERMRFFRDAARDLAAAAFPADEPAPPGIIQVTCTGYEAPTASQWLANIRGFDQTRLMQLGHMGCFAAIPATRLAALCARDHGDQGLCSVFHVELCSLHLNLDAFSPEDLIVHYLFGDGAIRYDLTSAPPTTPHFKLLHTFELLLPGTAEAMTWQLGGTGFHMTLAKDVPKAVAAVVPGVVTTALSQLGLHRSDVDRWAIHPGGPLIITKLAACLEEARPEAIRHSLSMLRQRGNMSSATLPHVWHDMLADPAVAPGELIVSLAFGPGLTVTGNILRKEAAEA